MLVTAETFHELMGWLKSPAWRNMLLMSLTADVFHSLMGWLKCVVSQLYATRGRPNIELIEVTLEVSHAPIGWLKAMAPWNIELIEVTLEVSHAPIGWLKDVAFLNIELMSITAEVFQAPMSSLKCWKFSNNPLMSITLETSHWLIWPYVDTKRTLVAWPHCKHENVGPWGGATVTGLSQQSWIETAWAGFLWSVASWVLSKTNKIGFYTLQINCS